MTQAADTSEKTPTSNIAKQHPKKYQRILTGFFLLLAITGAIYFAIQFYKLNNMKPSTSGKLRFGALTGLASSLFIVSILFLVINLTAELTVKKICKNWMKIRYPHPISCWFDHVNSNDTRINVTRKNASILGTPTN